MPASTVHPSLGPTSAAAPPTARDGSANGFKMPRTKNLPRPTTWFSSASSGASTSQQLQVSDNMAMRNTPLGPTSSASSSSSNRSTASTVSAASSSSGGGLGAKVGNLTASPGNPFAVPFSLSRSTKHRLSPSPSPHKGGDEDFVMISPIRPTHAHLSPQSRMLSDEQSSPIEDSPTPACGMASAAARLRLADEESPIRRVPGMSRSLAGGLKADGEAGRRLGCPPSPLKMLNGNLTVMPLSDGEGSPLMPETPSFVDDRLPPQPLFPLPRSQSQELRSRPGQSMFAPSKPVRTDDSKIPRLSASHPLRARASTGSQMDHEKSILGQKKAISLDRIPTALDRDEAFGSIAAPASALGHARRTSKGQLGGNRHKRINSGDQTVQASISRSIGHKSDLALSLGGLPDFSYSNSSLSSLSTNNMTPPISTFSPAEPPIFEDVKPLQEAFEQPSTALRKFKPRDSGVSVGGNDDDKLKVCPPSVLRPSAASRPRRPPMLKRTSSMGDQRDRPLETPIEPTASSGWPASAAFDFLGDGGLAVALARREEEEKLSMPDTPVKRNHYVPPGAPARRGMGHSSSQPSLGSSIAEETEPHALVSRLGRTAIPPPTTKKSNAAGGMLPHLTLTTESSSPETGKTSSPTVSALKHRGEGVSLGRSDKPARVGMLRLPSNGGSGDESEGTPTKGGGEKMVLASARPGPDLSLTPSKPPAVAAPIRAPIGNASASGSGSGIYPRMSLPAFANPKVHRTLHHRQSHPATKFPQEDENIFDRRFLSLETLGKGAFSTVIKVQEREGDRLFAVKKARGVFDGVRDRLRHLEEVDILRHLSSPSNPHVIRFADAWEQNRQLFIQTELCLGTLAFFLEEYGRVVERLDEGRVWKIIRELSDGIHHVHSAGVVHFDLKPANILISEQGTLKIGDFGMASRCPRISPSAILRGSGLGGSSGSFDQAEWAKIEREGDRVYMPPEMLQGVFGMPADIFSFGLVVLEVSTNICVPDGGPAWHSLRTDDFSVVDLSPLSPALADLITSCMSADPARRPTSEHIVNHPVIVRARTGGAALAPETKEWLADVLGGYGFAAPSTTYALEADIDMAEA